MPGATCVSSLVRACRKAFAIPEKLLRILCNYGIPQLRNRSAVDRWMHGIADQLVDSCEMRVTSQCAVDAHHLSQRVLAATTPDPIGVAEGRPVALSRLGRQAA